MNISNSQTNIDLSSETIAQLKKLRVIDSEKYYEVLPPSDV